MECTKCKKELPLSALINLAYKGKAQCPSCGVELVLANRVFILFLIAVLLLFLAVSLFFFITNWNSISIPLALHVLTMVVPFVVFAIIFGVLLVPAMEVKEKS